jgi:glyoxylase-like metal-dependent hydrolase (beta-lactamase superfamily II)
VIFRQFFNYASHSFTYLLADSETLSAVLIDPLIENNGQYVELINELGLTLEAAIDTHSHNSRSSAVEVLHHLWGCQAIVGSPNNSEWATRIVSDGDIIEVGELALKAIHTPGHTADSYSCYLEYKGDSLVLTGDTLLIRSTGRADLDDGDAGQQYQSLVEKLLTLPEATHVYPAHDYRGWAKSTISEERQFNRRLQVNDVVAYCNLMDELNISGNTLMDEVELPPPSPLPSSPAAATSPVIEKPKDIPAAPPAQDDTPPTEEAVPSWR